MRVYVRNSHEFKIQKRQMILFSILVLLFCFATEIDAAAVENVDRKVSEFYGASKHTNNWQEYTYNFDFSILFHFLLTKLFFLQI